MEKQDEQEPQEETVILVQRRVTQAVRESARRNGAKAAAVVQTEEHRKKLSAGQQRRREAERIAKESAPVVAKEAKRPAGRPRTRPLPDTDAPKRGKGRPAGSPNKPKGEQVTA